MGNAFDAVGSGPIALGTRRRCTVRPRAIAVALASFVALGFCTAPARAEAADQPWYERWFNDARDDIGKTLMFAAWPTVDYEAIRLEGIQPTATGAEVTLKVTGHSWLEGRIWTDVIVTFHGYKIDDIRFGRHSRTVFRPGETMGNAVEALRGLSEPNTRMRRSAPAEPPASTWATLCVRNASAVSINYSINWGTGHETRDLPPGETMSYRAPGGPQDFTVRFDTSFAEGITERIFRVPTTMFRGQVTECQDAFTYEFTVNHPWIGFGPATWTPGSEHPFLPGTAAGSRAGQWICAPGYQWRDPDDPHDMVCLAGAHD